MSPLRRALLIMPLFLLTYQWVPAMAEDNRALTLDVQHDGDAVAVRLIGYASEATVVSYTIEITGNSTSRHRGKTTLPANVEATLSTLRMTTGENWCVRLEAEEAGRETYEITRGNCATPAK
jgi:hypothetical protein